MGIPSSPPSVLHLSWSDGVGGSARSAYKIHAGLRALDVRSRMLVGWRVTDDPDVASIKPSPAWHAADNLLGRAQHRLGLQYLFYPSTFALPRHPWFRQADVVQLYNTHAPINVDFFSHTALPLLSRGKPLVWRLSDMWAFTGHCSYSYECERWRTGCGACPHLDVHPGLRRDTTALLWQAKRAIYARSRLTVVAPSRWMERLARESPLLGRFPVHRIPNGVDLGVFRPVPTAEARRALGVRAEGPVLLLGAYEPRKGQGIMAEALAALAADSGAADVTLLTVGARVPDVPRELAHHHLGEVKDDQRLALVYATADAFVFPTLAENLPNMVLESLACGVPVVSFDVGGVGDAVRPDETGYLARPGDARDLAAGMRRLLDAPTRARLAARSRQVAEQEYSLELQARRFLDLHRELLAAAPGPAVQ